MKLMIWSLVLSAAVLAQEERREPPKEPARPEARPPQPPRPPAPAQPAEPGRPPVPPPPPGQDPKRPPANVEEIRTWLRENEPETYRRLMKLQDEGRRPEVMQMLGEADARMRQLAELKERDPKSYERIQEMKRLNQESMELAAKVRLSPVEEREQASKQLIQTLSRLFDLREESRAQELVELKRRVDALEKALQGRKTHKERIVENRRKELLGERTGEEW